MSSLAQKAVKCTDHESSQLSLVDVFDGEIGGVKQAIVDARQLHAYLKNGERFSAWIKERLIKYKFVLNEDYSSFSEKSEKPTGGRPSTEYHLTLDTAKELSMVENNEQGRTARRYFIAMEKKALEAIKANFLPAISIDRITDEQQAVLQEVVARRSNGDRRIITEMWSRHNRHFKCPRYSSLIAVHFDDAVNYLETMELKQQALSMFRGLAEGRYLVVSCGGETIIKDIANCSVVDVSVTRKLQQDIRTVMQATNELWKRMSILTGDQSQSLLDTPLDVNI
jgi:phage anti-repressor protein